MPKCNIERSPGIGDVVLGDALRRTLRLSAEIAINLILVDALHERAAGFHERREFQRFPDQPLRRYLPVAKVRAIFPPDGARHEITCGMAGAA